MAPRLSSGLGNGKKNGTSMANGSSPQGKDKSSKKASASEVDSTDQVKRGEVEGTFEKYAQLIHAARRPLPTQSGDGSYLEAKGPNSMLQDLKAVGLKGVGTLMDVIKTKASGKLVDDKTYLMERVIQV